MAHGLASRQASPTPCCPCFAWRRKQPPRADGSNGDVSNAASAPPPKDDIAKLLDAETTLQTVLLQTERVESKQIDVEGRLEVAKHTEKLSAQEKELKAAEKDIAQLVSRLDTLVGVEKLKRCEKSLKHESERIDTLERKLQRIAAGHPVNKTDEELQRLVMRVEACNEQLHRTQELQETLDVKVGGKNGHTEKTHSAVKPVSDVEQRHIADDGDNKNLHTGEHHEDHHRLEKVLKTMGSWSWRKEWSKNHAQKSSDLEHQLAAEVGVLEQSLFDLSSALAQEQALRKQEKEVQEAQKLTIAGLQEELDRLKAPTNGTAPSKPSVRFGTHDSSWRR